jgi:lipopolysaccharide transport system ATP-binding protein
VTPAAVRVENLSKRYRIGRRQGYQTLREILTDSMRSPFRWLSRSRACSSTATGRDEHIIWALKEVSFQVRRGEVVGIIGRNGAGKSTLLKILTRITEPTDGCVHLQGRVGSLLEVGTGFHPELTGRENIFLNGAVLGMRQRDIERKFDDIVAFAEIGRFLDTPVKRYSSGMYMRLAFAVAAHLEPQILIVDEVLAVGDAAFQQKCLARMDRIAGEGRTVLFVSHNMSAILQLCTSVILLNDGRLVAQGPAREVVDQYLAPLLAPRTGHDLDEVPGREGDGRLRFRTACLQTPSLDVTERPIAGEPIEIVLHYVSHADLTHVRFMLTIFNELGVAVTHCNVDSSGPRPSIRQGDGRVICGIPRLPLPIGRYRIAVAAEDNHALLDLVPSACTFAVETSTFFQTAYLPPIRYSTALVDHSWRVMS